MTNHQRKEDTKEILIIVVVMVLLQLIPKIYVLFLFDAVSSLIFFQSLRAKPKLRIMEED